MPEGKVRVGRKNKVEGGDEEVGIMGVCMGLLSEGQI